MKTIASGSIVPVLLSVFKNRPKPGKRRVYEAQELGAGPYISKPYVMERLGLAVRNELDRPVRNLKRPEL
jgi:hypothetical protein